jgi:hypothetical protein
MYHKRCCVGPYEVLLVVDDSLETDTHFSPLFPPSEAVVSSVSASAYVMVLAVPRLKVELATVITSGPAHGCPTAWKKGKGRLSVLPVKGRMQAFIRAQSTSPQPSLHVLSSPSPSSPAPHASKGILVRPSRTSTPHVSHKPLPSPFLASPASRVP